MEESVAGIYRVIVLSPCTWTSNTAMKRSTGKCSRTISCSRDESLAIFTIWCILGIRSFAVAAGESLLYCYDSPPSVVYQAYIEDSCAARGSGIGVFPTLCYSQLAIGLANYCAINFRTWEDGDKEEAVWWVTKVALGFQQRTWCLRKYMCFLYVVVAFSYCFLLVLLLSVGKGGKCYCGCGKGLEESKSTVHKPKSIWRMWSANQGGYDELVDKKFVERYELTRRESGWWYEGERT